jgi:hypothetical protein
MSQELSQPRPPISIPAYFALLRELPLDARRRIISQCSNTDLHNMIAFGTRPGNMHRVAIQTLLLSIISDPIFGYAAAMPQQQQRSAIHPSPYPPRPPPILARQPRQHSADWPLVHPSCGGVRNLGQGQSSNTTAGSSSTTSNSRDNPISIDIQPTEMLNVPSVRELDNALARKEARFMIAMTPRQTSTVQPQSRHTIQTESTHPILDTPESNSGRVVFRQDQIGFRAQDDVQSRTSPRTSSSPDSITKTKRTIDEVIQPSSLSPKRARMAAHSEAAEPHKRESGSVSPEHISDLPDTSRQEQLYKMLTSRTDAARQSAEARAQWTETATRDTDPEEEMSRGPAPNHAKLPLTNISQMISYDSHSERSDVPQAEEKISLVNPDALSSPLSSSVSDLGTPPPNDDSATSTADAFAKGKKPIGTHPPSQPTLELKLSRRPLSEQLGISGDAPNDTLAGEPVHSGYGGEPDPIDWNFHVSNTDSKPLSAFPDNVRSELLFHFIQTYRTEGDYHRNLKYIRAVKTESRALHAATGYCLNIRMYHQNRPRRKGALMQFSEAGGDKERACDECVRQKRLCARIVGGEEDFKRKGKQPAKEFQLVFYPLPESFREGVSWDGVAFWIK